MASLLMLSSNDQLFQWLDRHPENDDLNPVPRLRKQVITSGHEAPGEWLRVAMPSLGYSTEPQRLQHSFMNTNCGEVSRLLKLDAYIWLCTR